MSSSGLATTTAPLCDDAQPVLRASRWLVLLFSVTVFWASALLFVLEPMFAKMILPVFGGAPAVWNTSMVFFQTVLFLGYIYSHYVANRSAGRSLAVHSVTVFLPLLVLPIGIRGASNLNTVVHHPAIAVMLIAAASIGLPFFVVSTSAPLLQRWFSHTAHRDAADPYFLYAASNAGSLIGLALYPSLIEPGLATSRQSVFWSAGYLVFLALTLCCGVAGYRWRGSPEAAVADTVAPAARLMDKLLWASLAFVPASLLYAFTAQISTDFPPIPLLWVIPLGLYLLTFVVAFSAPSNWLRRTGRLLPAVIVASMVIFLIGFGVRPGGWGVMGLLKLFCFATIALGFHAELANRRPQRQHLTEYYLWVSAGGILGGLLNAFLAPTLFSDFWEYPLTLLVAAALLPAISGLPRRRINLKFVAGAIAVASLAGIAMQLGALQGTPARKLLALAIGAVLCMRVPARWIAPGLLLVSLSIGRIEAPPLYQGRSFFGKYMVTTAAGGKWHILRHGNTIHGQQRVVDSPTKFTPQSYYIPVKQAFELALSNKPSANIAVVGLGAGIVGCYSGPGQSTTFFEIDPLVERIADRYFTFLSQCPGAKRVVLGDARLTLAGSAPHSYDAIVLDAFSSDAVPAHLLTKEAFGLYREKLTSDGILLAHISNTYLELAPVIAGSGARAGYTVLSLDDSQVTPQQSAQGRLPSRWMAVVPDAEAAAFEEKGWRPYHGDPVNWTDDYSSVFKVVMWQRLLGFELLKNAHR